MLQPRFAKLDSILPETDLRDTKKVIFTAEKTTSVLAINVTNLSNIESVINAVQTRLLAHPITKYIVASNKIIAASGDKNKDNTVDLAKNLYLVFRDGDTLTMWTNTYAQICSISVAIKVYEEPEAQSPVIKKDSANETPIS